MHRLHLAPSSRNLLLRAASALALVGSFVIGGCNVISGATRLSIQDDTTGVPETPPPPSSDDAPGPSEPLPGDASTDASVDAVGDAASSGGAKIVFVTSHQFNGAFGGAAAADAICRDAAERASLGPTEWRAWLSTTGESAHERIEHDGPYVLVSGEVVVASKSQLLSGTLDSAISVTETGESAPTGASNLRVWTGTSFDGTTTPDTCRDWTSSNFLDFGVLGSLESTAASWTRAPGAIQVQGGWGCQTLGRIYCFER